MFIWKSHFFRTAALSSISTDIIRTYVQRLKRSDARTLDLSSRSATITGKTVPIHISRNAILQTGVEELKEAEHREYDEKLDTRLPLQVNFRMESKSKKINLQQCYSLCCHKASHMFAQLFITIMSAPKYLAHVLT